MATKVMDYDIVVIGGGGTGMIAAVKAAELSGKKVMVLEKAKKLGGASIFAHGLSIYDSTWQKNAGEKVDDPPDVSGQFFDWLVGKGGVEEYFKVSKETTMYGMSTLIMTRRLDKYKDLDDPAIGPGWWASYIVDKMYDCCKKMDIPVLTETRAKKFVKDSSGKVAGVIAETRDGDIQVNFKACFIASGGFGANYKKCQEVWPNIYNNIPMHNLVPPALTGDVIEAAEEIGMGVDLKNAGCNVQGPIHHPYSYPMLAMMNYPGMGLQINMEGARAVSQGGGAGAMREIAHPLVYKIADQDIIEKAAEFAPKIANEEADKKILKYWREALAEEVAVDEIGKYGRHTTKADTLVELAIKLNIDPVVFLDTVEKYNKECESGKSQGAVMGGQGGQGGQGGPQGGQGGQDGPQGGQGGQGGQDGQGRQGGQGDGSPMAKYMALMSTVSPMPLKKGPFYAIFAQRFKQCTHGGIIVNEKTEVFDAKGNIMPGLFAGGDCTMEYNPSGYNAKHQMGGGGRGTPLFGNYQVHQGGGLQGILKGYTAAGIITEYLKKA
jgi:hypothetical protein